VRADVTAFHEAGHCVAAHVLGVEIVSAEIGQGEGLVITRHPRGAMPTAQAIAREAKLALIDLCGVAAERRWGASSDEQSAARHSLRLARLLRGGDTKITDEVRAEAAAVLERLRDQAELLVSEAWPLVERVANALREGTLTQVDIDALIEDSKQGG
jgi:hypothetical protein